MRESEHWQYMTLWTALKACAAHLAGALHGVDEARQVGADLGGSHAHHHRQPPRRVVGVERRNHGHQIVGVDLVRYLRQAA